jgi:hypothetical protein
MAQIDPNIAMGFRPIQIESPINQMAAISQLENARQQQQMNMLQMQEYARKAREDQDLASQRNALAQIHSNLPPGVKIGSDQYLNIVATKAPRFLADIMDQQTKREALVAQRELREAQTEERQFQLGQKKEELSRAKIKQAIADIADFDDLDSINADIDRKITSGELSQDQAAQIRSKLPADNAGVPAWQRQTLLSLMDLKDRVAEQARLKESTAPKWELRKVGEREILVDTNPKSATVGQMKPGVEPLVDTTPKPTQIKVGEAVFYRDMNPNSPTYGTNIGDVFVDEEPKWELKTVGNKQMLVDTNPRSPTVGQMKPGAEALVDKTAKYTARDIGGKIVYVDENPDSPTFGQQKAGAELIKTAAPTAVTESPLARLERELADAVKTHGANSPQAKNIRNKIEQETGGLERQRIDIDRQRLGLERYKASKGDGSGRGPGPGTKLEKGEIWNEAEQRIETVPGSKLNIAQSNAHNKDRESLKAVETKAQSAIAKIDELLSPKYIDGFRANFSGDLPYSGVVTQYFAPDARRRIDSLKSDMKNAGLELIRAGGSIGQITEREWPIIEQMIAAITPDMTYQEAELQMKKVRAYLTKVQNNAKDSYQNEWGGTQYFKPTERSSGGGLSPADKQALAWANANPKDPRAAKIKARLGVNK